MLGFWSMSGEGRAGGEKVRQRGSKLDKEEKLVVGHSRKRKERFQRPMFSSNFNKKRMGCKSSCSSIRTGCKSIFKILGAW